MGKNVRKLQGRGDFLTHTVCVYVCLYVRLPWKTIWAETLSRCFDYSRSGGYKQHQLDITDYHKNGPVFCWLNVFNDVCRHWTITVEWKYQWFLVNDEEKLHICLTKLNYFWSKWQIPLQTRTFSLTKQRFRPKKQLSKMVLCGCSALHSLQFLCKITIA